MSRHRQIAAISMTALATALAAQSAAAQTAPNSPSYVAGNPTVTSGNVTYDRGFATLGTEVYTVSSPTAVLDFVPTDAATGGGPINFQLPNTTVIYQNGGTNTDFVVLNRIVPADQNRPVQFNGSVISRINTGGVNAPGGTVWFYSPGGIVLGSASSFDVGNLLLTTRDPIGGGTTISTTGSFIGGGTAGHGIVVQSGATINASPSGSYVAMVAPYVNQGGAITVNGSTALVAAEQAQLTVNNGLFDIAVTVGTDSGGGTPLQFTGSAGGPSSTGAGDPQGIYMVAVPKNTAITMLIAPTGDLGFDVAASAGIVNGQVVLSAGHDVSAGTIADTPNTTSTAAANINITQGNFTSSTYATATTSVNAGSATGTPDFAEDVTLRGGQSAVLGARQAGQTMTIGGQATVIADGTSTVAGNGGIVTNGGTAQIYASNGGAVDIGLFASVHADASASISGNSNAPGIATAGTANIYASGGTVTIRGGVAMSADASGYFTSAPVPGATLHGGVAQMFTGNGGSISVAAQTSITASASGGGGVTGTGGTATGGTASISTANTGTGGGIDLRGDVVIGAIGNGNSGDGTGVTGGSAVGGQAFIQSSADPITIAGNVTMVVAADAGDGINGADGGNATAGTVQILSGNTGSVDITGSAVLNAFARGGDDSAGGGDGIAGTGTGGTAFVQSDGAVHVGGLTSLAAYGFGGSVNGGTGTAGDGIGGTATIRGRNGSVALDSLLTLDASGYGGTVSYTGAADGGDGVGGGARIDVTGTTGSVQVQGLATVRADGYGGGGGLAAGTTGGNGFGGNSQSTQTFDKGVYVVADQGDVTLSGGVLQSAEGVGGGGAIGGNGTGGLAYLVGNDGVLTVEGATTGRVDATGGSATFAASFGVGGGSGGSATGGYFEVGTFAQNGTLGSVHLGAVDLGATANGGDGADGLTGTGGAGGNATGGTAQVIGDASTGGIFTGTVALDTSATGGNGGAGADGGIGSSGFVGGLGGNAQGGTVQAGIISGQNLPPNTAVGQFGNITMLSAGVGGDGGAGGNGGNGADATTLGGSGGNAGDGAHGGDGGTGTGGAAILYARGVAVSAGDVLVTVGAAGGNGGTGGTGGTGGLADPGNATVPPGAAGADGADAFDGNGGAGKGGEAGIFASNRGGRTERGVLTLGAVTIQSFAFGGDGHFSGTGTMGDGVLSVVNADATIDSLVWANDFGQPGTLQPEISIEVANGTLDTPSFLAVRSAGDMSFNVHDGGRLTGGTITLSGGGSLLPRDPAAQIGTPGEVDVTALGVVFSGDVSLFPNVTADTVSIVTGGTLTTSDITSRSDLVLSATDINTGNLSATTLSAIVSGGGNLLTGDLTATQGSALLSTDSGSIQTGDITATDSIDVEGIGDVTTNTLVAGSGGYDNVGADIYVSSDFGSIAVGDATGLEVTLDQGNDIQPVAGTITAGNLTAEKVTATAFGDVTVGDVTGTNLSDAFDPPDGLQIVLGSGQGSLNAGNVTGQSTIILGGLGGSVSAGDLQTPGSVAIFAQGDITVGRVNTGTGAGDTFYVSDPSVLQNDPLFANYDDTFEDNDTPIDPSVFLQASRSTNSGTLTAGPVSTGNFHAAAGSSRLGDVTATREFSLLAAQVAAFTGQILSPDIDIASNDIDIALGAALGSSDTQTLKLTSLDSMITLGGDVGGSGYVLGSAEAKRIHGQNITITANGTQTGDIIIRGVTFDGAGGGNQATLFGNNASLTLNAHGSVQVLGGLAIQNSLATDKLLIVAGSRIVVVTDQGGSIAMTGPAQGNAQPGLAGTLNLSAPVIGSGSSALIQQLSADPRYAGLAADLAAPAADPHPEGYIQAGRIELAAGNVIAIQNSGTADLAAGFTAGTGGMEIRSLSALTAAPAYIDIWGRVSGQNGGYVTNLDTGAAITLVTGNGSGFDAASTVNGCAINTECRTEEPGGEQPGMILTTVEALEEVLAANNRDFLALPAIRFVRLIDQTGLVADSIITEPVSGTGNAGLWDAPAETGRKESDR